MLHELKNGPYLSAIGWTDPSTHAPASRSSSEWAKLEPTVEFDVHGHPTRRIAIDLLSRCEPLSKEYLKSSGVARARSAAKSTIFAAVLARKLAGHLKGLEHPEGIRVSLGAITSSAVVPIVWQFESVGLTDSWENADTMLLPASIPSSMVTAISHVTNFHASAVNYAGGASAVFEAMEHAYLDFFHDRADHALILCAEEVSMPLVDCMKTLGLNRDPLDGASGFVLSREEINPSDWQIAFTGSIEPGREHQFDPSWDDAARFVVAFADDCPIYTSTVVPQAMQLATSSTKRGAILDVRMGQGLRHVMGMRRGTAATT